jgi:hypothetical protein
MGSTSGRGVHHRKKTYFGWPKELTSVFWEVDRRTLSSVGSTWLTKDKAYPSGRVRPRVCVHTHPDLTETARPPAPHRSSSPIRTSTGPPLPGAPPDDPTLVCPPARVVPHPTTPPSFARPPVRHPTGAHRPFALAPHRNIHFDVLQSI